MLIIMETNIILYHTDGCPQCQLILRLLNNKNIKFKSETNIDVMLNLGINHTPTLQVDNKMMTGKEAFDWINNYKGN
jgi:glutaredoxin